MRSRIEAVLRGGLADDIAVGLAIWVAYEVGRQHTISTAHAIAKVKGRAEGFAEGTMDAYRRVMN